MNLTYLDPLWGDMEIEDYPKECFLAVMSKSKVKENKFHGSVAACINAHIIRDDSEAGFKVFAHGSQKEMLEQLADDPCVIGIFSEPSSVRELMNRLADTEKQIH